MQNYQIVIRNLTVAQLDALNAFLSNGKILVSSKEISSKLIVGTGKSLSALASLQLPDPAILQKYGKKSALEGSLWGYNNAFGDIKEVAKLVKEIIEKYKVSGVINEKNP